MTAFLRVVGVIFIVGGLLMVIVGGGLDAQFYVPARHYGYGTSRSSLDLTWLVTAILGAGMLCTGPVLLGLAAILDSLPGGKEQRGPFAALGPGQAAEPDGVTPEKKDTDRGATENRPASPAG